MNGTIIKDETARLGQKENEDRTVRFFREQMATQVEHLASQVNELNDSQILSRGFHRALNNVLYALAALQGVYGEKDCWVLDSDPPF
jgi:hypothetical protein